MKKIKILILLTGDVLFFYAALAMGLFLRYTPKLEWTTVKEHLIPLSLIFIVWLFLFGAFGLYDLRFLKNSKIFLYRLIRAMTTNTIVAIVIFYLIPFPIEPRRNLFIVAAMTTLLIFMWRYLFNLLIIRAPASRLLFFGTNHEAIELAEFLLKNPQLGQKPVGYVFNDSDTALQQSTLPFFNLTTSKLAHILEQTRADTIIIGRDVKENKLLTKILFQVVPRGIAVVEFTKLHEMTTGKIPLSLIGEIWFIENLVGIKKGIYEFFKRVIDIMIAIILIIPTIFIFPLAALAIILESEGPIFFRQKRVGRNNRIFQLVKFRSMVKNAETLGGFKNTNPDPRHTKMGALLRKSYLDELPQIINILRGEMSLVGPRPERPEFVEELKQKIPFYEMRLLVHPGITGWAQINMENDASVEDAPEKMQYDLYYIKNRSFVLDILIMLRTISALLRRQGR